MIPALDEAPRIAATLRGVPAYVDAIVVVDDGSGDGTVEAATRTGDPRVTVVSHAANRGVGRAVATGYAAAVAAGADVVVVIGADGQMDPADMLALVRVVASGEADYAKGNRLARARNWLAIPPLRLAGTLALSVLTNLATGSWTSFDSQCGYTAISREALRGVPLDRLFDRYGYPNDLLIHLARSGARVKDVPVRAIYGPGTSKMRIAAVWRPLCGLLWRGFLARRRDRFSGMGRSLRAAPASGRALVADEASR